MDYILYQHQQGQKKIISYLRNQEDPQGAETINCEVFYAFADPDALEATLENMVKLGDLEREGDKYRVPATKQRTPDEKVEDAIGMILENGGFDGNHHKQWVLDQTLRILLGDRYDERMREYRGPDENGDTYSWDEGIAP